MSFISFLYKTELQSIYGCLEISGEEAEKYLQGQLTSDIKFFNFPENFLTAQLTAHCNAKGRVVILGYLIRPQANRYIYFIPKDILETAYQSLSRFILRAKVKISKKNYPNITVLFSETPGLIQKLIQKLMQPHKPADYFSTATNHFITTSIAFGLPSSEVSPPENQNYQEAHCITDCITDVCNTTPEHFLAYLARHQIPWLGAQTQGEFLPDELKLNQHPNAICLTKGCYIGQEIIARMHYRGLSGEHSKNKISYQISQDLNLKPKDVFSSSIENTPLPSNTIILCQVVFNQMNHCLVLSKQ